MILASAHPVGMLLSVASALAYAVPALRRASADGLSRGLLLAGWLLHAGALASGLLVGSPRFGFASAMSVTAWLVLAVYAVESRFFPALQGQRILAGICGLAVLLPLPFPGALLHVNGVRVAAAASGARRGLLWVVRRGRGARSADDAGRAAHACGVGGQLRPKGCRC